MALVLALMLVFLAVVAINQFRTGDATEQQAAVLRAYAK